MVTQRYFYATLGTGLVMGSGGCYLIGSGLHHLLEKFPVLNADLFSTALPVAAGSVILYCGNLLMQEGEREMAKIAQLEQILNRELTVRELQQRYE